MPVLPATGSDLSQRERVIVAGVARGRTNAEISTELEISPFTVKSHLARISRRYGVHGRSAIVVAAYERGDLAGLAPEPQADIALSPRERQVLDGMRRGLDNHRIGRELFLTEDTVKSHAQRMFRKLGARSRSHAVALGHQRGLFAAREA